jgi:hypothetical protein
MAVRAHFVIDKYHEFPQGDPRAFVAAASGLE